MSPDKRHLALLLLAGLAIGCNPKSDASTGSSSGAAGPDTISAAVSIATLTPEATLAPPPTIPPPGRTPPASPTPLSPTATPLLATSTPTFTPTATPTATPSPSPTPTSTSTPRPTITPTPTLTPTPIVTGGVALSQREQQLFAAHNQLRAAQGIVALELNPVLMDVARERAQTMADSGVFSHYAPNGDTVFDLLDDAGYAFGDATENTHFNNVPSGEVSFAMSEYQKSPPHLANILDPGFRRVGIGFVTSTSGVHYVVVVFSD